MCVNRIWFKRVIKEIFKLVVVMLPLFLRPFWLPTFAVSYLCSVISRINVDCAKEHLERFALMDSDQDGEISFEDFALYYNLPISTPVEEIFKIMDRVRYYLMECSMTTPLASWLFINCVTDEGECKSFVQTHPNPNTTDAIYSITWISAVFPLFSSAGCIAFFFLCAYTVCLTGAFCFVGLGWRGHHWLSTISRGCSLFGPNSGKERSGWKCVEGMSSCLPSYSYFRV